MTAKEARDLVETYHTELPESDKLAILDEIRISCKYGRTHVGITARNNVTLKWLESLGYIVDTRPIFGSNAFWDISWASKGTNK